VDLKKWDNFVLGGIFRMKNRQGSYHKFYHNVDPTELLIDGEGAFYKNVDPTELLFDGEVAFYHNVAPTELLFDGEGGFLPKCRSYGAFI
jgi:hypothetical protein